VTHDPVASSYADAVLFLVDGEIVASLQRPTAEEVANYLLGLERGR
jgi:putative ABC transport system ATP-binding protein